MKTIILTISIVYLIFTPNVFGALSGGGTQTNPYLIQSRGDFDQFANPANSAIYWASGKYTKLTCDLNLSTTTYTRALIAPDTDPVAGDHQGAVYDGNFDGNGHKITGLTILAGSGDYIGLFAMIGFAGVVKNLGLENISITGDSLVGGLAAFNYGSILNCYSTGTVTGVGTVSGTGDSVGGLLGRLDGNAMYGGSDGDMTNCYSTCTVRGHKHTGGLVGFVEHGDVSSCYAAGDIGGNGSSSGYHLGGLAGYSKYGFFSNCYAAGTVSGVRYIGGLIGAVHTGSISKCYSTTRVIGTDTTGGLAGDSSNLIYDCFWDIQTSGQTTSAGGTGKTTAQMKTQSTYTDAAWNFTSPWRWIGFTYPRLNWENVVLGPVPVPNVAGLLQTDATNAIIAAGLNPGTVTYQYSNYVLVDHVVSQSLSAGTMVSLGTNLNIVVSLGYIYSGGAGTAADPYKIANMDDLLALAEDTFNYDKHFILINDVNLASHPFTTAVLAPDTDAATASFQGTTFTGVFDGGGRTISGLVINGNDFAGLFGKIDTGGQVKNLALKGVSVSGDEYVGAVAGWNASLVSNCYSTGVVTGNIDIGGLTGVNGGTISTSYSTAAVSGNLYIGGLAGVAGGGTFTECYAAGSVSGTSRCGAITGNKGMTVYANRCYFRSTAGPDNGIGRSLTEDEMIQQRSFVDWDFVNTWRMPFFKGAPVLLKFPATAFAQSGTESDPYRISSSTVLSHVAQNPVLYDSAFVLTKNIDLTGQFFAKAIIAADMNSLNSAFDGTPFTGVFDGNGYKIFGFTIDGNDYTGLFGQIGSTGQVKDLDVEGSVTGNQYVGALAGDVYLGNISNCYSVGDVNGVTLVGGMAGRNAGTLSNCYSAGDVNATGNSAGGLVGINSGTLADCHAGARVHGVYDVGGLTGYNWSFISRCYSTGSVTGDWYVGGLAGSANQYTSNITASYSTGPVSGNAYIGGLAGMNKGASIENCYASGPVTGNYYVGGFVGGNVYDTVNYDYSSVSNCYSTGPVSGYNSVGGFAGENGVNYISQCYFLNTAGPNNSFGTPLTSSQMKQQNSYSNWNFNTTWAICQQTNYPRFLWQIPAWDLRCPDGCGFEDFSVLAQYWSQENADINLAGANIIDFQDIQVICQNWLTGR
ncbi:MAG: hypothetical protein A2Y07_11860 [Planctomycetes bacterium GWF2_50_10]|nr:MAG: hypothetical protein A2Y07_11860 [Planctomycetes bacterium GWF2_50_10]